MNAEKDVLKNIEFIKKTMESAGKYKNLPGEAYISAGLIAIIGCLSTYWLLGSNKLSNIGGIEAAEIKWLAIIWSLVLIFAVLFTILFSIKNAKRNHISPWNSLTSRLFLSQIPIVFVAGVLTLVLTSKGLYELIPALWLLLYGVIVFSFSYFTGFEHRIQSYIFLLLGTIGIFASATQALLLLTIGFGVLHVVFGVIRLKK